MEEIKKIVCSGCGAEFADKLPKCPYCDLINYKGAEKEYLNKLEDVREDMGELAYVPEEAVKAEIKKQGHLLRRIIIIVFAVIMVCVGGNYLYNIHLMGNKSEKEQFLWENENFPKFDALYEAGEYEELVAVIKEAFQGEYSIWEYEHRAFAFVYGDIIEAKDAMKRIDSGEDTSEHIYASLLYNQMDLIIQWGREEQLSAQERQIIEPLIGEVINDFHSRWQMSDEDYEKLMKKAEDNYHVMPYNEVEKYVEKWLKNRE